MTVADMKFICIAELEKHLQTSFAAPSLQIEQELPPQNMNGDIAVNCFRLAKWLRKPPPEIARMAGEYLAAREEVESIEIIKAYVNVTLTAAALFSETVADNPAFYPKGLLPASRHKQILLEFSAPNTNKPQHLGHVRNNTLGQAMVALFRRVGHKVVAVNLINDRGIHICKSMLAYQRFGQGETPQSSGKKGDHLVGDYYVRFDLEFQRQLAELREKQPELKQHSDEDLFPRTEIGQAAQEMLLRWEAEEPEVRQLWQTMNQWVIRGFEQTYRRLGVVFDHTYLESATYTMGRRIIQEYLEQGVFKKRRDGAVTIDLNEEKLGEKVVLRSDGTSVYVTQDIGTTVLKQQDHQPQRQIWVVGDEQIHHFKVLFAILRKLGFDWAQPADAFCHMAYGMINLPSGKMKSRQGTVVDADDLLDEMETLAREATLARYEQPPEDLDQRARKIAVGALKFMLLKVNPRTTTVFDPEASLKFEGDTGPYILYAYARIASMLRKAGEQNIQDSPRQVPWQVLGKEKERNLAMTCALYEGTIQRAAAELDTSILANYLLDLAKAFSRFYRECPVLNADTDQLRLARLELSRRVRDILYDGLHNLTIDTLESM